MITFKNADVPRSVAAGVSLDNLLLETDSPYLAPVPHRGKRNEPMHIPIIASKVAELHGKPVDEVAKITSGNVRRLFGV
jgi:TatD DNase family protein